MSRNGQENVHVIDVRTPAEFMTGHVVGSINIPLNELQWNIEKLKGLDGQIILCCASGGRSGSAMLSLKQQGFDNVVNGGPWVNVQQMLHY